MEAGRRVVRGGKKEVRGGAGVNTVTSISSGATVMQLLSAHRPLTVPSWSHQHMVTDSGSGLNEPHVYLECFSVERKKQH